MSKVLSYLSLNNDQKLRPEKLGQLKITSGKIVACDPLVFHKKAFEQTVEAGKYPLFVWFNEEEQIAAAQLKFSETTPVRWELAIKPGEKLDELEKGEVFGYPVDTGLGCFADIEAINNLEKMETELQKKLGEDFISLYDDLIDDVLTQNDDVWGDLKVCENTDLNIILFSSGYGDGFYATYWGFDEEDRIVSLVTDFDIL